MLTINLDDDAARLVQAAARVVNQPLDQWVRESICKMAQRTVDSAKGAADRVSPLHPGAMQPAADFNAHLEEFAPYA